MITKKNIFTSGWEFDKSELDLKSKFQMINVALLLSSLGLFFGIVGNLYKQTNEIIPLEVFIILFNILFFFLLRWDKNFFKPISLLLSTQYSFLFLYLFYTYSPESLKFIWLFTYPIVLLYFQEKQYGKYWMSFVVFMILIAPQQPLIEVQFSQFQAVYLSVVLIIVTLFIHFYQNKMDSARDLIFEQQEQLREQINELKSKDKLLSIQSKQAVMGEMISMIAHQWRQPLSSVTLSISDIQLKKMLGNSIDDKVIDTTLQDISDTVVYLSETIDDFQTYFNPNKEVSKANIDELIQKAINFTKPRVKSTEIEIEFHGLDTEVQTYPNEFIQVVLNILNNAIDELLHLKKKPLLIEITLRDKGDSILIDIKDNAAGILEENLDTIFEPYYSTKGKNGTGLGLYMSQMIMQKQFNSSIKVKSSSLGSTFTLRVPKKLS